MDGVLNVVGNWNCLFFWIVWNRYLHSWLNKTKIITKIKFSDAAFSKEPRMQVGVHTEKKLICIVSQIKFTLVSVTAKTMGPFLPVYHDSWCPKWKKEGGGLSSLKLPPVTKFLFKLSLVQQTIVVGGLPFHKITILRTIPPDNE